MGNDHNGMPIRYISQAWDYLKNPMSNEYKAGPYAATGKTLPEAKDGMGNINAEKQEQVMGDFNGDGMPVLMNVDGPPHTAGGKDLEVPDNSFIFSDTASLRIKNPDTLKSFGVSKAQTPAQIAKKYDLIAQKKIIDDPEKDDLEKKTAQYNYINSISKLNELASVQESMKAKKGIPNSAGQQPMGQQPIAQQGGSFRFDQQSPYNTPVYDIPYVTSLPGTLPDYGVSAHGQRNDIQGTGFQPLPAGGPDSYMPQMSVPQMTSNMVTPPPPNDRKKGKWNYQKDILNPDQMRDLFTGLRAASYPNYQPTRQIAHGAVPQAVYMDPTRALAAQQEAANAASYNASQSGTGPVSRAMAAAIQGQAGAQSADIVSKYAEANASIANRANEQAAGLYNQLFKEQQGYNKDYTEEVANAAKDRFGFQSAIQNEYLKGRYADRARKQAAYNANYINPYYSFDEQGYIHPKTNAQQRAVLGITGSAGQGTGTATMSPEQVEKVIKDHGLSTEEANKFRAKAAWYALRGPATTVKSTPYGVPTGYTQRGYGNEVHPFGNQNYVPAPEEDKYGGKTKKRMKIVSVPR